MMMPGSPRSAASFPRLTFENADEPQPYRLISIITEFLPWLLLAMDMTDGKTLWSLTTTTVAWIMA